MATSLPAGWEADYDASKNRWFYLYKPTGLTQWTFPQPGDEYPQFYDPTSGPLVLEPEERLASERQLKRQDTDGTCRGSAAADGDDVDSGEPSRNAQVTPAATASVVDSDHQMTATGYFDPEQFMYLGTSDDEDGDGTGSSPRRRGNGSAKGLSPSSARAHMSAAELPSELPSDARPSPLGHIAELIGTDMGKCAEELAPVELDAMERISELPTERLVTQVEDEPAPRSMSAPPRPDKVLPDPVPAPAPAPNDGTVASNFVLYEDASAGTPPATSDSNVYAFKPINKLIREESALLPADQNRRSSSDMSVLQSQESELGWKPVMQRQSISEGSTAGRGTDDIRSPIPTALQPAFPASAAAVLSTTPQTAAEGKTTDSPGQSAPAHRPSILAVGRARASSDMVSRDIIHSSSSSSLNHAPSVLKPAYYRDPSPPKPSQPPIVPGKHPIENDNQDTMDLPIEALRAIVYPEHDTHFPDPKDYRPVSQLSDRVTGRGGGDDRRPSQVSTPGTGTAVPGSVSPPEEVENRGRKGSGPGLLVFRETSPGGTKQPSFHETPAGPTPLDRDLPARSNNAGSAPVVGSQSHTVAELVSELPAPEEAWPQKQQDANPIAQSFSHITPLVLRKVSESRGGAENSVSSPALANVHDQISEFISIVEAEQARYSVSSPATQSPGVFSPVESTSTTVTVSDTPEYSLNAPSTSEKNQQTDATTRRDTLAEPAEIIRRKPVSASGQVSPPTNPTTPLSSPPPASPKKTFPMLPGQVKPLPSQVGSTSTPEPHAESDSDSESSKQQKDKGAEIQQELHKELKDQGDRPASVNNQHHPNPNEPLFELDPEPAQREMERTAHMQEAKNYEEALAAQQRQDLQRKNTNAPPRIQKPNDSAPSGLSSSAAAATQGVKKWAKKIWPGSESSNRRSSGSGTPPPLGGHYLPVQVSQNPSPRQSLDGRGKKQHSASNSIAEKQKNTLLKQQPQAPSAVPTFQQNGPAQAGPSHINPYQQPQQMQQPQLQQQQQFPVMQAQKQQQKLQKQQPIPGQPPVQQYPVQPTQGYQQYQQHPASNPAMMSQPGISAPATAAVNQYMSVGGYGQQPYNVSGQSRNQPPSQWPQTAMQPQQPQQPQPQQQQNYMYQQPQQPRIPTQPQYQQQYQQPPPQSQYQQQPYQQQQQQFKPQQPQPPPPPQQQQLQYQRQYQQQPQQPQPQYYTKSHHPSLSQPQAAVAADDAVSVLSSADSAGTTTPAPGAASHGHGNGPTMPPQQQQQQQQYRYGQSQGQAHHRPQPSQATTVSGDYSGGEWGEEWSAADRYY